MRPLWLASRPALPALSGKLLWHSGGAFRYLWDPLHKLQSALVCCSGGSSAAPHSPHHEQC